LVSTPYNKKTEDGGGSKTPESTVDATRDLFQAVSAEWAASQQCKDLVRVFESVEFPDVKQILAFACGSITAQPAALRRKATRRSMYQHALLITVCKLLNIKQYDKNPHPISAWAQDPVYSPIDAKVLGESGVKLLENPDGFLQLDNSTAVLSFSPNVPVKQIVTELCRPAVMLWNEVMEDSDAGPGDGSLW
jgi:SRR1